MDSFTETGAKKLVKTIKAYWAAKGFTIKCEAIEMRVPMRRGGTDVQPLWCVRSDMVNGLPTIRSIAKLAA